MVVQSRISDFYNAAPPTVSLERKSLVIPVSVAVPDRDGVADSSSVNADKPMNVGAVVGDFSQSSQFYEDCDPFKGLKGHSRSFDFAYELGGEKLVETSAGSKGVIDVSDSLVYM